MIFKNWPNQIFLFVLMTLIAIGVSNFNGVSAKNDSRNLDQVNSDQNQTVTPDTPWLDAQMNDHIAYFIFDSDNYRIERFDFQSNTWLTHIVLSDQPTAFTVDNENLYISFGRRISRFNLEGGNETHLKNTLEDVNSLLLMNNYLFLHYSDILISINKNTGTYIDDEEMRYRMIGLDIAPSESAIFGRSSGVSPSDIVKVTLNSDGTIEEQEDSPYHGDYPNCSQTYVFPDESRVTDGAGIIYNTSNLTYSNSLGGAFDDLDFYFEFPIILRDGILFGYSKTFLETGQYTPVNSPLRIFVVGDYIYSFYEDAEGIDVEKISIDDLEPLEPGDPVDPHGIPYDPDIIFKSKDDIIYVLNRANLSIFRYSIPNRDYISTIPLISAPDYIALSKKTNRLYLSYPLGKITCIDLNESLNEFPFVNSPQPPIGLSTAGEFLFVCDPSGAWVSHFTYDPHGDLISQVDWSLYSDEYIWSEVNHKLYYFRDGSSPNDILYESISENGEIGDKHESPYHGDYNMKHPIRVSPNGSIVVTGSGQLFDANSLEATDVLSNDIDDAIWVQGSLYTIRPAIEDCQIQKWGANFEQKLAKDFPGTPIRLFSLDDGILCITSVDGIPTFYMLNPNLEDYQETLKVNLLLSQSVFTPGDSFVLKADITNPGHDTYENIPFVVMLEVYGTYFFHPTWSETYSHELINLNSGTLSKDVLSFIWPDADLTEYNLKFYGALLNYELSSIMGIYDVITFGCESE